MMKNKRFFRNHQVDLKKEPNDQSGNKGIPENIIQGERDRKQERQLSKTEGREGN